MNEPHTFGRYRLTRRLAVGGMAEVFLATASGPEGFSKRLALKRILPDLNRDESFVRMFLDEARLAARFNHPNVVQIFDLGVVDGSYFVAMEYIPGASVADLMAAGPIPLEHALKIIIQACDGLEYTHNFTDPGGAQLNLVHRDVSPQNLFVSYDGVVKVLDFGIAKASVNTHQTRTDIFKGKIAYVAPEQITRATPLDRRTDIFSLGIVLYRLVTGERPFTSDHELGLLAAVINQPPRDPRQFVPDLPEALVQTMMRSLEKSPDKRQASMRELRSELEAVLVARGMASDTYGLATFVRESIPVTEDTVQAVDPSLSEPTIHRSIQPAVAPKRSSTVPLLIIAASVVAIAATLILRRDVEQTPAPVVTQVAPPPPAPVVEAPPVVAAPPRPRAEQRLKGVKREPPKPPAPATGLLDIASVPATRVTIDGTIKAQAPTAKALVLPAGDHDVTLASPELGLSYTAKVHVTAGEQAKLTKTFAKGKLEVLVMPYGEVFIDDKSYGVTPLDAPVELWEGTHRVRIVCSEINKTHTASITVRPSETARIKVNLR